MAGDEITIETLRQLLNIQTELRDQAERKAYKAQRSLVSLLETFSPEEIDRRLKAGDMLDNLPIDDLEHLIRQQIGIRINQLTPSSRQNDANGELQTLRLLLQKKQDELSAIHKQLDDSLKQFEAEKAVMQNRLAVLNQLMTSQVKNRENGSTIPTYEASPDRDPGTSPRQEPVWMEQWRSTETFERDAFVLKLIGDTGLSRRPVIEERMAKQFGIKNPGGSLQSLLSRLDKLGMATISRPWKEENGNSTGGRLPDLVRLTEQGELAYWMLTGKQAMKNEYDRLIIRHVSPEHTLLNLQAADVFVEAGYQVNQEPSDIHLPGGGVFMPDLSVYDATGVPIFVEVEREAGKYIEKRQAKWRNFYQASGGKLFVFCDNRSCMRGIRSELNYYFGNQPVTISLTNLADLKAGKRGEGDSIWLEVKKR